MPARPKTLGHNSYLRVLQHVGLNKTLFTSFSILHDVCFSLQLMGPQFISAIKPALEEHWNSEVEEAWTALFGYIAHTMKAGMADASGT